MQIRTAHPDEAEVIRSIAHTSLEDCCGEFLTAEQIDDVIDEWYPQEALRTIEEDDARDLLVVERENEVVGFAELSTPADSSVGTIERLHVDPDHRDRGVLEDLFSEAESMLYDRDVVRVEVLLLGGTNDLLDAAESAGFEPGEESVTMLAGTPISRQILFTIAPDDPDHLLVPKRVGDETFYIAFDQGRRGGKGAFFAVYRDENRDRRYGFYCDNCGSVDTTMDPMGRVACATCGNTAKPTEWDATNR